MAASKKLIGAHFSLREAAEISALADEQDLAVAQIIRRLVRTYLAERRGREAR